VRPGVLSILAARAVSFFPHLESVRVVRSWAALRVMTRDGYPVYDQSEAHPGAFVCTCHSGVTLGAVHALEVAPAILGGGLDARFTPFGTRRFDVPAAA
jgi:glycine/D-amino acid oxidase-like deaminating enzyme